MSATLLPSAQWAQQEFAFAQLGDQRRHKRLVNIAEHLAAHPGGTLPQAFLDGAELKAAYRFFGQRGVSFDTVLAPHVERTRQACRQPGEYLLIEDTTLLDYSGHVAAQGLGRIGNGRGRGFELHSTLAVRVEGWTLEQQPEGTVVGLFGQQCDRPKPAPKPETPKQRFSRTRRSQIWAAAILAAGRPPAGSRWIYVADAESDFYEAMNINLQQGVDLVVRASHDRRLAEGAGHLRAVVSQGPVLGQMTVAVRARGGQPARQATVELRSARVNLDGPWRPSGWQAPLSDLGVVEVREIAPPADVPEPLHWLLLTTLPCATWALAQRVVGYYTARWWIEEYHKALKSGTGVESSQLEEADRLEGLIAILAVVATRLLSAKMLARSRPESQEAATSLGPLLLTVLEKKLGPPHPRWSNRNLIRAIARVGGFIGRKSDGEPGWQTIWRGWQRLSWMCEGANLIVDQKRCG
jgi:hypothetical protein